MIVDALGSICETTPEYVVVLVVVVTVSSALLVVATREPRRRAKETMDVTLTAGVHTLTILVDASGRKEPLRVELDDKPGSPARVRVVGGK